MPDLPQQWGVPSFPGGMMFGGSGFEQTNPYSQYASGPLPYPATYSGVPTDARGVPIQSYLDWQKANPGGTTINQTPAQPAAPSPSQWEFNNRMLNSMGANVTGPGQQLGDIVGMRQLNNQMYGRTGPTPNPSVTANMTGDQIAQYMQNKPDYRNPWTGQAGGGGGTTLNQTQAAPNDWDAALAALSNPGRVTTPGSPYTPSGPPTYG